MKILIEDTPKEHLALVPICVEKVSHFMILILNFIYRVMTAQPLSDTFADGLCYIYLQVLLGGKII